MVPGDVFAQSICNFRIGLERCDVTSFPYESRSQQREKSNICSDVIEIHPRPKVLLQGALNFGLSTALERRAACTRIQP